MFPGTYVPRYRCSPILCSPVPLFPGTYVPRYLCSPVPMFPSTDVPRTYVPRYLCSPVPMFPEPMFPGTDVPRFTANFIGVNITAFGRKLTLFTAIPLSRFSLKMSRFFACFELEKMHSMLSAGGVGNQLPMLGKGNSFGKFIKLCVFYPFVKLRLCPGCVGPGIKGVIVARAKST